MILENGMLTLPHKDYLALCKRIEDLEAALKPFADVADFYESYPKAFGHPAKDDLTLYDTSNTVLSGYPHYKTNPIKQLRVGHLRLAQKVYYKREE